MVIDLYVAADESGIQAGAPYCLVSGYIGSPRQWNRFEDEWMAALEKYGVPHFHSKIFFARDENGKRLAPYTEWTDEQAVQFLEELLKAIQKRRLHPVGGAVDTQDFYSFSMGERRLMTGGQYHPIKRKWLTSGAPTKPYYLAMLFLLVDALQLAKEGTRVNFVFDRQNVLQARAVQTFQEITRARPVPGQAIDISKLGQIAFDEASSLPSLQAADLHTHCWYSFYVRDTALSQERVIAMNGLTQRRNTMRNLNAPRLEALLSQFPAEYRALVQQS